MKDTAKSDFDYMPPEMKAEVRTMRALSSVMQLEGGFNVLKWSAVVCAVCAVLLVAVALSVRGEVVKMREQNERLEAEIKKPLR